MNSGDSGSFNRLRYDGCAYSIDLAQSVEPLQWQMYPGKFENCSKCIYESQFWRPFDNEIVDRESELKGIMRRETKCFKSKYSPGCKNTEQPCLSTFGSSVPIVYAQEICPIVHSGLPKITDPGYVLNTEPFCTQFDRRRNPYNL